MGDIYLYEVGAGTDVFLRDPAAPLPPADTTPPTLDGGLTWTATSDSITIDWSGTVSADNVAVARREYRIGGAGAYMAATSGEEVGKSHTFTGLNHSTTYQVDLRCVDISENVSSTLTVAATTEAPASGGGATNYIRCKLAAGPSDPHLNLASIHWALFQQLLPSVFGAPIAKGIHTMVAGSDSLEIPVSAATVPAGWYMLALADPDGTTTVLSRILVGP